MSKEAKANEPQERIVAKRTFIDGVLHDPGARVEAYPKVYPDFITTGDKRGEPHPKAGQIVEGPGMTDGFGDNLAPADAAIELPRERLRESPPAEPVPDGSPPGSVMIGGVVFAPVSHKPVGADKPMTLDDMSRENLKSSLDSKGVKYDPKATRAALQELAEANNLQAIPE